MALAVGDRVPAATLMFMDENGPHEVALEEKLKGKKVVLFGLPGAFTGTCHLEHLPSFVRNAAAFADKGVDDVICVSVNDLFVMQEWGEVSGAKAAGITMLCDPSSTYAKAIGMEFSAPPVGLYNRLERHAMIVEDGVVTLLHSEEPGTCNVTAGEAVLAEL
ncbi:MAG: peroxiredoxin [Pseudomonadota bacterium]